jgi:hypothetical protein
MMAMTGQIPNGCAGWHSPALTNPDSGQTRLRGDAGQVTVNRNGDGRDRAGAWLRGAILALAVLAVAAAAVSWDAQYVLVKSVKHNTAVASIEAAIPDIEVLIFAALGIALALHGKRAIRARTLNIACVGTSLAMNALASSPGWRELAVWVMPAAVYALASDTLIGVIRAWTVARTQDGGEVLGDDEATPWQSLAASSCGCCAWPSPRHPRSAASAAGLSRNARRARSPGKTGRATGR